MKDRIFVIGASVSGISALQQLVRGLPADFPAPILVAQHVGPHGPGMLPAILSRAGRLPAVHPEGTAVLKPGRIYVAPPDRHLVVRHGYVTLSHGPRENFFRPAIDVLFRSAALAYGPRPWAWFSPAISTTGRQDCWPSRTGAGRRSCRIPKKRPRHRCPAARCAT